MNTANLIIILGSVAAAVIRDLASYQAARRAWRDGGRGGPAPAFDIPLFLVSVAIGLAAGICAAFGVEIAG